MVALAFILLTTESTGSTKIWTEKWRAVSAPTLKFILIDGYKDFADVDDDDDADDDDYQFKLMALDEAGYGSRTVKTLYGFLSQLWIRNRASCS